MLKKLAIAVAVLLLAVIVVAIAGFGIARALLPRSACSVTEAQYRALSMEMAYEKARSVLGCDGVLLSKQTYGDIVIETYAWRGTAWPYGRVQTTFINGTLQGTDLRWLDLSFTPSNR
jgi:hypothetical protein